MSFITAFLKAQELSYLVLNHQLGDIIKFRVSKLKWIFET